MLALVTSLSDFTTATTVFIPFLYGQPPQKSHHTHADLAKQTIVVDVSIFLMQDQSHFYLSFLPMAVLFL
jgi:hypothetical protein